MFKSEYSDLYKNYLRTCKEELSFPRDLGFVMVHIIDSTVQ